jgi:integrase
LYCGLRHSETCRLLWEEIDFNEGVIRLGKQKNKTSKPAPLMNKVKEILEKVPKEKRVGHVILYKGKPTKSLRDTWKSIVTKSGIYPTTRYHDLRHTFSTRIFNKLGFYGKELTRHSSSEAFRKYLHSERKKLFDDAQDIFDSSKGEVEIK